MNIVNCTLATCIALSLYLLPSPTAGEEHTSSNTDAGATCGTPPSKPTSRWKCFKIDGGSTRWFMHCHWAGSRDKKIVTSTSGTGSCSGKSGAREKIQITGAGRTYCFQASITETAESQMVWHDDGKDYWRWWGDARPNECAWIVPECIDGCTLGVLTPIPVSDHDHPDYEPGQP